MPEPLLMLTMSQPKVGGRVTVDGVPGTITRVLSDTGTVARVEWEPDPGAGLLPDQEGEADAGR